MQELSTCTTSTRLIHVWRLMVHSFVVIVSLCLWAVSAWSQCEPEQYMDEHEPARRAMVIGNWDYTFQTKLPSAATDATEMRIRLTNLNFEVDPTSVMKTKKEFFNSLINFVDTIKEGDLVVFYFSGHGFSHGAYGFLAPTELPTSVVENKLLDVAVALDSVRSLLESKHPGMVIMILDACRTIGDFVIAPKSENPPTAPDTTANGNGSMPESSPGSVINLATPGLQEPRGRGSDHSLVAFAAEPGHVAIGNSADGQMSTYTRWLVTYLPNEGRTVHFVFSEAATDVVQKTGNQQVPKLISTWLTNPYLRPTPVNRNEERTAWEVALHDGRERVERYLLSHSVTRHAAAARRWLNDPKCGETGFTAVSPIAVERAFSRSSVAMAAVRTLTARGLGFPRSIEVGWEKEVATASDKNLGIVASGTTAQKLATEKTGEQYVTSKGIELTSNQTRKLAFTLASMDLHEDAVTTKSLEARSEPTETAELVSRIKSRTPLKIRGLEEGPNDSVWMKVVTEDVNSPSFIKVDPSFTPKRSVVELGKSLKELIVKPRLTGLPDLIDPQPLKDAVADLRSQGWTITWVSLATGAVNDEQEQAVRDARLAHAKYLLTQLGVPGVRITAVTAVNDFKEDGVRIRFFGVGK